MTDHMTKELITSPITSQSPIYRVVTENETILNLCGCTSWLLPLQTELEVSWWTLL